MVPSLDKGVEPVIRYGLPLGKKNRNFFGKRATATEEGATIRQLTHTAAKGQVHMTGKGKVGQVPISAHYTSCTSTRYPINKTSAHGTVSFPTTSQPHLLLISLQLTPFQLHWAPGGTLNVLSSQGICTCCSRCLELSLCRQSTWHLPGAPSGHYSDVPFTTEPFLANHPPLDNSSGPFFLALIFSTVLTNI